MIKEALLHASFPVKVVIFILFSSSIFLWTLIIYNFFLFLKMDKKNTDFIDFFWSQKNIKDFLLSYYSKFDEFYPSPLAKFCSEVGFGLSRSGKITRFLEQQVRSVISDLSRFQFIYATIGSSAPFVGLFGTVWGIMHSFRDIARMGRAGLEVVAPGIAEALFTTALGLFVAIPSVIAYNFFQNKIKKMSSTLEMLSSEIERELSDAQDFNESDEYKTEKIEVPLRKRRL